MSFGLKNDCMFSEKLTKSFLFTLCLMLFAGQATAYFTWGMNSQTCDLYVSAKAEFDHARDQRTHLAHLNWIKGFITGINWRCDSDIARDLSVETVDRWIDACSPNFKYSSNSLVTYAGRYLPWPANSA